MLTEVTCEAVADMIVANDLHAPTPSQFSHACLDALSILLGPGYVLRAQQGGALVQTGYAREFQGKQSPVRLGDTRLSVVPSASFDDMTVETISTHVSYIQRVLDILDRTHPRVYSRLVRDLDQSLVRMSIACSGTTEPPIVDDGRSRLPKIIGKLQQRFAEVMEELEASVLEYPGHPLVLVRPDREPCLNLSLSFRDLCGNDSWIHHALTRHQHELLVSAGAGEPKPTQLFGSGTGLSQSIQTGFLQVWEAADDDPGIPDIFQVLFASSRNEGDRMQRFLTVPMHLGGIPWLAVSVFLPSMEQGNSTLFLYRDFIPVFFAGLRSMVRRHYNDQLANTFMEYISSPAGDLNDANAWLMTLAQLYPFQQLQFSVRVPEAPALKPTRLDTSQGPLWVTGTASNPFVPERKILEMYTEGASGAFIQLHAFHAQIKRLSIAQRAVRPIATQDQARAWAHDVKNYTQPLIHQLNVLLRESQPPPTWYDDVERIRRGVVILNAVSGAIQWAVSSRLRDDREAKRAFTRLPRRRAPDIIQQVLLYLLEYQSALATDYHLHWEFENDSQFSENSRSKLTAQELARAEYIWVLALLREVIQNIRLHRPILGMEHIRLSFSFTIEDDTVMLTVKQRQYEQKPWAPDRQMPVGIQLANALYGPDGARVGRIESSPPRSEELSDHSGFEIAYDVRVSFSLEQQREFPPKEFLRNAVPKTDRDQH